ncbi:MAG: DNA-directed RNA polymerase subunit H [Candidatus Woesearchaeota archaeon]|nr:MAG: DNA-directed RNA polymerase subunit H [Candidatus Woesearchaeota archaeon]
MARKKKKSSEKLEIKNHILVPKHEKCSESEKKMILQKYSSDLKDFPKININDAALYNLDVKPGDLIKITRESPTSGKAVFYRVVIEI